VALLKKRMRRILSKVKLIQNFWKAHLAKKSFEVIKKRPNK